MSVEAAKKFSFYWNRRGYEKGDTQKFWLTLLKRIFEIDEPETVIDFEKQVKIDGQTKYIDGYVARTKVLIEQKSFGVNLAEDVFEQAKRYADALPADERPQWIITCNFAEFWIYDLNENLFEPAPKIFKLCYLPREYTRLKIFFDPDADPTSPEEKISRDAANIVEKICLAIDKKYLKREPTFRDLLSKLCTRLVFCFYADDAGIFTKQKFGDWLRKVSTDNFDAALQKFFEVLATPENERHENFDDDLKKFPYVNGGLFDEKIDLPKLNKDFESEVRYAHNLRNVKGKFQTNAQNQLITFSWREISPPIFGAMFESLLNPNRQRKGGMYYTSEENIHKVIDPLFLDDLRDEFNAAKHKRLQNRPQALRNLQDKIASLNFLDPACGSGNFLTETFLSLRDLENEILDELQDLSVTLPDNPVKVSVRQFYGIEIDPFAAAVAQVALWIAEIQMRQETESRIGKALRTLPLSKYVTIKKANALRVDWKDIAPNVDYIIGNPPFVGGMMTNDEQNSDLVHVWGETRGVGEMDYVSGWYKKAADFIRGTKIRCAFVSTNSITQGQQSCTVWQPLFDDGIHIDFAHRTFKWLSDSENMAHVHCVIVGFSKAPNRKSKKIFDGDNFTIVKNINAYLVDGENIFVENRNEPLCKVPPMRFGSMPRDGGYLIIEADELDILKRLEPAAEKFIRQYVGADEFINGKPRYCLWLVNIFKSEKTKLPIVAAIVAAVQNFRLKSKAAATRNFARTPHWFCQIAQPKTNYILVPRVSSERRQYIPIGFMPPEVIASDATQIIPDAQVYHFGILTSSIHMAWVRATCGRLESRYRYSKDIVYNNFPWPTPSNSQRRLIEESAQKILDVRKNFSDWTFAKLYDEDTMPAELRSAHKWNDYNVALAYGFEKFLDDEPKIVSELMKLYKRLTS